MGTLKRERFCQAVRRPFCCGFGKSFIAQQVPVDIVHHIGLFLNLKFPLPAARDEFKFGQCFFIERF